MKNITLKEKKALLDAISSTLEHIDYKMNDLLQVYEQTDELIQDTRWDSEKRQRVPLFNEDGTPSMILKWDYITKKLEDLDEDAQTSYKAYEKIVKELEKLI